MAGPLQELVGYLALEVDEGRGRQADMQLGDEQLEQPDDVAYEDGLGSHVQQQDEQASEEGIRTDLEVRQAPEVAAAPKAPQTVAEGSAAATCLVETAAPSAGVGGGADPLMGLGIAAEAGRGSGGPALGPAAVEAGWS